MADTEPKATSAGETAKPRTFDRIIADITAFDHALADYERVSEELPLDGNGWGGGGEVGERLTGFDEDVGEGVRLTNARLEYLKRPDVGPIRDVCEARFGDVNRNRLVVLRQQLAQDGDKDRSEVGSMTAAEVKALALEVWPKLVVVTRPKEGEEAVNHQAVAGKAVRDDGQPAHSPDFRSVLWCGTSYSFTANQALAMGVLWQAWEQRTPDVGDETILSAVDSVAPPSRLNVLFRDHPAWGTMVVAGGTKGTHRLADATTTRNRETAK